MIPDHEQREPVHPRRPRIRRRRQRLLAIALSLAVSPILGASALQAGDSDSDRRYRSGRQHDNHDRRHSRDRRDDRRHYERDRHRDRRHSRDRRHDRRHYERDRRHYRDRHHRDRHYRDRHYRDRHYRDRHYRDRHHSRKHYDRHHYRDRHYYPYGHGHRRGHFSIPKLIARELVHALADYHYGRHYYRSHGHYHEIYRFPVYSDHGVSYRPYAYCEGRYYATGRFDDRGDYYF